MSNLDSAIACLVAAVLLVGWREWASGSSTARDRYPQHYRRAGLPIWIRNFMSMVPLWAIVLLGAGVALLVPRQETVLAMVPTTVVGLAAFGLSYRSPVPLTPDWLRDATRDGTAPLARPRSLDWVIFTIVMPLGAIGEVGLVLLLVRPPGS